MTDINKPALVVRELSHRYGEVAAVRDAELSVEPGELVCLVGPSGCGKTTLLRLVAGLEEIQQGEILIEGESVAVPGHSLPPEARGVGMLFQDYALFPHLRVGANVAFGLGQLPASVRTERVMAALGKVDMQDYAGAYPHQLSGGQQQRVALARALAPEPRVMLLDEPFSGLDQRLREQVRDQAFHVLKDSGAATVMVTHDPEEAMFMADRIAVMKAGRIEQVGSPVRIYFHPASAFVASFFSEVNELSGTVRDKTVATPFGNVPADRIEDGTPVDVLIRPEALRVRRIDDDGPEPPYAAKVLAARILGRSSLIHLCVGDHTGEHLHLHSRVPGRVLPADDEIVSVDLDIEQAFVFPRVTPT